MQRLRNNLHIEKKCIIIIGMKGWRVGSRVEHVEHPSEEKFFEHCTNCAILPRPLSRDHFCENLASLLFHSSAGERLQINKHSKKDRGKRKLVWNFNDPSGWEKYHRITSSDRSLL